MMYFIERHSDSESLQLQRLKGDLLEGSHERAKDWTYVGTLTLARSGWVLRQWRRICTVLALR
jgi:hypothetical protein|eukprot:SAG25_NODE_2955_length_1298_cov_1.295246_1_plen_63_part_00